MRLARKQKNRQVFKGAVGDSDQDITKAGTDLPGRSDSFCVPQIVKNRRGDTRRRAVGLIIDK